jgi:hypothetical protein
LENAGQQSLTNTSPAILRQLQRHQPNPPPSPRPQVPNSTHRPSPGGRK